MLVNQIKSERYRVSQRVADQAFQEAASNKKQRALVAAFLFRGGSYITYGVNCRVTDPLREGYRMQTKHAETRLIKRARPGDVLLLVRWTRDGKRAPISPCSRCAAQLAAARVTVIIPSFDDNL